MEEVQNLKMLELVECQCQVLDDMGDVFRTKRNKHIRDYFRFNRLTRRIKKTPRHRERILCDIAKALRIVHRHVTPKEVIERDWQGLVLPEEKRIL